MPSSAHSTPLICRGNLPTLFLLYLQAVVIKAWCPFCLLSTAIILSILIVSILHRRNRGTLSPFVGSLATRDLVPVALVIVLAPVMFIPLKHGISNSGRTSGLKPYVAELKPYVAELKLRYGTSYTVPTSERFAFDPNPRGGPVKGSPNAPVTIVEFSDFECSHCARAHTYMHDLIERRGDDIRITFKHLPLERRHPHAKYAAIRSLPEGGLDALIDQEMVRIR